MDAREWNDSLDQIESMIVEMINFLKIRPRSPPPAPSTVAAPPPKPTRKQTPQPSPHAPKWNDSLDRIESVVVEMIYFLKIRPRSSPPAPSTVAAPPPKPTQKQTPPPSPHAPKTARELLPPEPTAALNPTPKQAPSNALVLVPRPISTIVCSMLKKVMDSIPVAKKLTWIRGVI
ncbi:anther-specific proline-rich protein APG-like [Helianthus annuus]|uniref:anther-specific proline-rich protein APG-like n=1 Tax=Helianthus annuus TaxID=4232 RepID=UPI000B905DC0|nr:anther-specific proline-rich protein APG-like [Helianthus annuus]